MRAYDTGRLKNTFVFEDPKDQAEWDRMVVNFNKINEKIDNMTPREVEELNESYRKHRNLERD